MKFKYLIFFNLLLTSRDKPNRNCNAFTSLFYRTFSVTIPWAFPFSFNLVHASSFWSFQFYIIFFQSSIIIFFTFLMKGWRHASIKHTKHFVNYKWRQPGNLLFINNMSFWRFALICLTNYWKCLQKCSLCSSHFPTVLSVRDMTFV